MDQVLSIAIETSCRRGQVCLGQGDRLLEVVTFDADQRHAVQLVARLAQLLAGHGLVPSSLNQVYVSVGPGSFTGLRVGLTVARTLVQALPAVRAVAVPTAHAVAENAADIAFETLGVLMDAKEDAACLGLFTRRAGLVQPSAEARLVSIQNLASELPKPILLLGEALEHCTIAGQGIRSGDKGLWLPSAEGVWRVGRRLAAAGQFADHAHLLPLYLRKPEAVRLWEKRQRTAK